MVPATVHQDLGSIGTTLFEEMIGEPDPDMLEVLYEAYLDSFVSLAKATEIPHASRDEAAL